MNERNIIVIFIKSFLNIKLWMRRQKGNKCSKHTTSRKQKKKIKIPDTNDSYPHFFVLDKRSFRKNVI